MNPTPPTPVSKNKRIGKSKVFNDSIHGHIAIDPACVLIIDTPQFQRLQKLLQLGPTQWVFPGATHKRFAHSIGVCYLAGKFVEDLRQRQPEYEITDVDVLCIKIAGLCHDLGHGPLSHTYDGKFVKTARPDLKWDHEWTSANLFEHLLVSNDLKPILCEEHNMTEDDFHFIKELIFGAKHEAPPNWIWKGRGKNKDFLYEIVANHRNEIDVDKFDYFKRDCYHLGIPVSFDCDRLMRFARIITDENDLHGTTQIAYHEKESWNIYELFHTRFNLHKRAYQHRVTHAVEKMLCDALLSAEPHFRLTGKDGQQISMAHAMHDVVAFTRLNDSIFDTIRYVGEQAAASSSNSTSVYDQTIELLDRLEKRDLYPMIGEVLVPQVFERKVKGEENILKEILTIAEESSNSSALLKNAGIYIDKFSLNYGMGDQNPVDHVTFYNRNNATEGRQKKRNTISNLTPRLFREYYIRVYIKDSSNNLAIIAARNAFDSWVEKKFHTKDSLIVPSTPNSPARSTERPKKRQRSRSGSSNMGKMSITGSPSSSSSSSSDGSNTYFKKVNIAMKELDSIHEEENEQVDNEP
jgi:HD superfamily phosphohydrolase